MCPRLPGGVVVRQDGEADHIALIVVVDTVIVQRHAPAEMAIALRLHLDVDQHPHRPAVAPPHFHQLIDGEPSGARSRHQLLELLVQHLDGRDQSMSS